MRVIIADDNLLMRQGVASVLAEAGIDVIGQAADGASLLRLARDLLPDAVVIDIRMPPTHTDEGLVTADRLRVDLPGIGIVVLSHYLESSYAMRLIERHPEGAAYLLKDRISDPALLVDAVRRVCDGETVVDPTIVARLLGRQRRHDPLAELTPREREVLALVAEGLSNRAISAQLVITERTVEAHINQIFAKLELEESPDAHRRVLAVIRLLRV